MQYMLLNKVFNEKDHKRTTDCIVGALNNYVKRNEGTGSSRLCDSIDTNSSCANNPRIFRARHQIASLEKKRPVSSNSDERKLQAYKKFLSAEVDCKEWNEQYLNDSKSALHEFLVKVAKRIERILGPAPSLVDLEFQFGPGSSSNCTQTNVRFKLDSVPSVASIAQVPIASRFLDHYPSYQYFHKGRINVVGSKLSFVPKNALIDRPIIIEPTLNTVVQKMIGQSIRKRLMKIGVDLKQGQEFNRSLAQRSSFDGSLSTIDLSSASDCIPYKLVFELIPEDWFILLSSWRSPTISIPKSLRHLCGENNHSLKLNKFSSMGNGFTFELESLIFYCICYEASRKEDRHELTVYGDDIIIGVSSYESVVDALLSCNFKVNKDKSFTAEHPFRESCGGDYFHGFKVTPFYLKKSYWTFIELIKFYNHVRNCYDEKFMMEINELFDNCPYLDKGPPGYGLGYINCDHIRKEKYRPEIGFDGYVFAAYREKPNKISKFVALSADSLVPAYSAQFINENENSFDMLSSRGSTNKLVKNRIYIL